MAFTPATFRAQLTGSGTRPNLFDLLFIFPASATNGNASQLMTYMARAASIPPANVGTIDIKYFGRSLKYPGDRVFPEWNITIINDENFAVRDAFAAWSNSMNSMIGNLRSPAAGTPAGYSTDVTVRQYDKLGNIIKTFILRGAWPSSVGDIQLDWNVTDTIEEFPVVLQYQWWEDPDTSS